MAYMLFCGARAYLFSSNEGSCCVFSALNNFCKFLASGGGNLQSILQSLFKTAACGAFVAFYRNDGLQFQLYMKQEEIVQTHSIHGRFVRNCNKEINNK